MIYRLKHGDIIKPLVVPMIDGSYTTFFKTSSIYSEEKKSIIFDQSDYLWRLYRKARNRVERPPSIHTRFYMFIEHENRVKLITIGRTLHLVLESGKDLHPKNNTFLEVSINDKVMGGNMYPNKVYDESRLITLENYEPTIDSDDINDWVEYVKSKQDFFLEDYLKERSIFKNIDAVDNLFWKGSIRGLQQEDRNGKLEELLDKKD
jgi:hypothetical protein